MTSIVAVFLESKGISDKDFLQVWLAFVYNNKWLFFAKLLDVYKKKIMIKTPINVSPFDI